MNTAIESVLKHAMGVFYGVLNTADNYIVLCDQHRQILYINPALSKRIGVGSRELLTDRFASLFSKRHRSRYIAQITKGLRDEGHWHGEIEIQTKKNATFWSEIHVMNFTPPDSSQSYVVCIGYDLTAKRMLQERSWQAENPPAHIIDSMRESLFVVDHDGKILMCNKRLPEMVSYPREEIIGIKPPYPWIEVEETQKYIRALKSAKRGISVSNYTLIWRKKDNTRLVMSHEISPLKNGIRDAGKRFVISARDMSNVGFMHDLRRAEERIEILQSDLKRKAVTLSTILEIQRLVLYKAPISNIFKEIIRGVQELLRNDLAGIYLVNPAKKTLSARVLSKRDSFSRSVVQSSLPLGSGLVGTTAVTGRMMLVNNAQMDPRSIYPYRKKPQIEHVIVVPLRVANTVFGVLAVARHRDPGFVEEDALLIESFAEATTIAIENARLVAETRKDVLRSKKGKNNPDFDDLSVFASSEVVPQSANLDRRS